MFSQKFLVTPCRSVPALVLNKFIVAAQIHRHGFSALRTFWDKLGRYLHILLKFNHIFDNRFIVISCFVARLGALKQPVIPLRIEKP